MTVEVKRVDTITAQVPVPASQEETLSFIGMLSNAADSGYIIKSAAALTTGQRDPYTVGLVVTMSREQSP